MRKTRGTSGKPKGGRPSKAAAQALDRRILETAAELFATQGFAATSMEQVATACGAGKDTIYRRYPAKAALFTGIMEDFRKTVICEVDELMSADGASMERLRRYARLLLSINLRPQLLALNRVALGEAVAFGGVQPTPTAEDPLMVRFAALVQEAQAEGALRQGDPLFMAEQLLYATSIKPLIATMLGSNRFSEFSEQERYFDEAWKMFLEGAAP